MGILDKIHSTRDIKELDTAELEPLCGEIRAFLLDSLSRTGGHLASNLGTVELMVALHRVYDSEKDRLVFDVGHQSYTHKIITGRKDRFDSLRQYEGLSGFPRPYESADDAFIAGHASNSVAVAVGMARARTLLGADYDVAAVIGDGALTGGLAYEGLSSAAASREPLVIVLNDNNMSIDPNVGGMAMLLQKMRVKPGYISFKRRYREALANTPALYRFTHRLKEGVKSRVLPDNMFSAMDLNYLGPVDGHDVQAMEFVLRLARELREPVIVHVLTQKGKGCDFAEEHPELYHGVGPFDPFTGRLEPVPRGFSDELGAALCELAGEDERITAITAAMAAGTGISCFAEKYPERFVDVGIAEGAAASLAAGLAKQGSLPVFAVYSSFLQRAYDMLIHDVALQGLHVVLAVDRAGLVGGDGETHHGVFDLSYLRSVPGMTILCPASFMELRAMLRRALYELEGPVALRYPRGGEGAYKDCAQGRESLVRAGGDLSILCYGSMVNEALAAAERLAERGISAEIVKINEIGEGDYPLTAASLEKTGRLLMLEEVCQAGCLGETILAQAAERGQCLKAARLLNLGGGIVYHGDRASLLREKGLDAQAAAEAGAALCGK